MNNKTQRKKKKKVSVGQTGSKKKRNPSIHRKTDLEKKKEVMDGLEREARRTDRDSMKGDRREGKEREALDTGRRIDRCWMEGRTRTVTAVIWVTARAREGRRERMAEADGGDGG